MGSITILGSATNVTWNPIPENPKDERAQVIESWGLDIDLNIEESAADFYLLYELYLEELDEGSFEPLLYGLVDQFASYTDMILGGELRHLRREKREGLSQLPPEMLDLFYQASSRESKRWEYWAKWKVFRAQHPLALQWAIDTFMVFGGGSIGGDKWANIAKMLMMFEEGKLTPIMFVDFCWGLEHNGGTYFNKVWMTKPKIVLNANLDGNITKVLEFASPGVRNLYRSKNADIS
jgi:hypothetical protein